MTRSDDSDRAPGWPSLAVLIVALVVAVYLAFQIIGFVFKLVFLVGAVVIARAAWRAWRAPA